MDFYHLTPNEAGWELKKADTDFGIKTFATRADALAGAAELLEDASAVLQLRNPDGSVEQQWTYPQAADPRTTPR